MSNLRWSKEFCEGNAIAELRFQNANILSLKIKIPSITFYLYIADITKAWSLLRKT